MRKRGEMMKQGVYISVPLNGKTAHSWHFVQDKPCPLGSWVWMKPECHNFGEIPD